MIPPRTLFAIAFLWLSIGSAPAALGQSLLTLEVTPAEVEAGTDSQGTVTLDGPAGPEGTRVFLLSSDPSVASVPGSVTVPSGQTTADFTITTGTVEFSYQVQISAALGRGVRYATLTVDPAPPKPLLHFRMGGFGLSVVSYDAFTWDPELGRFTGASGSATAAAFPDGLESDIPVLFQGVTIENPFEAPSATAGSAALNPSSAPFPLALAGFTLHLAALDLDPNQATAKAKLQLPPSFADRTAPACQGARLDLGSFTLTPDCELYLAMPQASFGPFTLGSLGIVLHGQGLTVDFSSTQSPLAVLPPSFRGLVLDSGETVAASSMPVSNTGYLKGHYGFASAVLSGAGLSATFNLIDPFTFETLEPFGYTITLGGGTFSMKDGAFLGGTFSNWSQSLLPPIQLPTRAVRDYSGNPAAAYYTTLEAQADLDLYAEVTIPGQLSWGDLSGSQALIAYKFGPFQKGYLYFSGAYRSAFRPVDLNGDFLDPPIHPLPNPRAQLEAIGMGGLTIPSGNALSPSVTLTLLTPDVPNASPIIGTADGEQSWINVGSAGVHGEVLVQGFPNPPAHCQGNGPPCHLELGDPLKPYYKTNPTNQGFVMGLKDTLDPIHARHFLLLFQFIDSAVYHSEGQGSVYLHRAVNAAMDFSDLNFTSTAHCPGARIKIPSSVKLDYWQLDLVQKPQSTAAGPLSVKTGQIFLIAAGIKEPRHFEKAFWLTWGEVLASGDLGAFIFDLDSSGQRFDGFDFVAEDLALSPYDEKDAARANAYLRAAGTAHYDFFGADYLHIHDHYDPNPADPFQNRHIVLSDSPEGNARPTERSLARDWGGDFGSTAFHIRYDDADQDGLVSDSGKKDVNHMQFLWIEGQLLASLDLSSKRICMSVHEPFDVSGSHDVTLPPLAHFGAMGRVTGCACIEGGQLRRVHLEGEAQAESNTVILGTDGYMGLELDLTPATTELRAHGDMALNLFSGFGNTRVVGQARFLVNRDEGSNEGDLGGRIEAGSFLGAVGGALSADGQLSWHVGGVGPGAFHSLQGRVAVGVVAPGSVGSVGLEGGFYVGYNAPSDKAWVLKGTDPRYKFDLKLPAHLTGVFGYVRFSASVNYFVLAGGYEVYAGLGAFADGQAFDVVGQMRVHLWGSFLGGLLSAAAWADLQFVLGTDPQFEGKLGLEACALWVVCAKVEVGVLVDEDGVHLIG